MGGLGPPGFLQLGGVHLKREAFHYNTLKDGDALKLFKGAELTGGPRLHELSDEHRATVSQHAQREAHGCCGFSLAVPCV